MNTKQERLTLSVKEAAAALGIAPLTVYNAVAAGSFPSIKVGKRILIPRAAIEKMLGQGATI